MGVNAGMLQTRRPRTWGLVGRARAVLPLLASSFVSACGGGGAAEGGVVDSARADGPPAIP
jgi:hypothetical protein